MEISSFYLRIQYRVAIIEKGRKNSAFRSKKQKEKGVRDEADYTNSVL